MTRQEAYLQSEINLKKINEERERKRIEEEIALKKHQEFQREQFNSNLKLLYYPDAIRKIAYNVEHGLKTLELEYGSNNGEVADAVSIYLRDLGYDVSCKRKFYEADSGDPDSGEGRCDSHWEYSLIVSWEANEVPVVRDSKAAEDLFGPRK